MEAPTPVTELVQKLDDETLARMAQPPHVRLFPILRHASAMRPLIALAAILPALVALRKAPWTQQGTEYALRQIGLLTCRDFWQFWEVFGIHDQIPHSGQTPLPAWLGALSLRSFGTDFYGNYVLIQLLSVAGIIAMTFRIAHQLGGMRMGLFSAFLLAFQSQTMRLAQEPGPAALAILLSMIAMWGMNTQWRASTASISWPVVFAGLGLGLCALSGGPLCLLVIAALLLNRSALDASLWLTSTKDDNPQKRKRLTTRGWKSLGFCALIAFLVSAPWTFWMLQGYRGSFVIQWLLPFTGEPLHHSLRESPPAFAWWLYFPSMLVGPILLGICDCAQEACKPSEDREIRRSFDAIWLLTWCGIATLIWSLESFWTTRHPFLLEMWREFALIPLTMLAAWGIITVADREVPLLWVVIATLLSVMLTLVQFTPIWLPTDTEGHELIVAGGFAFVLALGGWWLVHRCDENEARERQCMSLLLTGTIGLMIGLGVALVPQISSDDQELQELRKDLIRLPTARRLVFVTPQRVPPELEFAVRSVWPYAESFHVDNWTLGMNVTLQGRSGPQEIPKALIVCWDINDSRRFRDLPNAIPVHLATTTRLFQGRELNVFRLEPAGNPNLP